MISPPPLNQSACFSQQLRAEGIEQDVINELLKSSYALSLKKGDRLCPSLDQAAIIYYHSGCLVEMLVLTDEQHCASSLWTQGYLTVCLPPNENRFQYHHNYFLCLFDADLTIIPQSAINKLKNKSSALINFIQMRANEYLHISHNMALMRTLLDKRQNIILRLLILNVRTSGSKLALTLDDLCLLTNTTRQYCGGVIKQLQQDGLVSKQYGCLFIKDLLKLQAQLDRQVLLFLSHYMSLTKQR